MPFEIVAIKHDSYRELPSAQHRWLLMCLARYADREGRCWPSMRQLAQDARMSLASVCRYLKSLNDLGVFHRTRRGVGRYRYQLAEAYVPRWPGRVSSAAYGVPHGGKQKPNQQKHANSAQATKGSRYEIANHGVHDGSSQWRARLAAWASSGGRFWPQFAGPRPDEPGYWGPSLTGSNAMTT